MLCFEESYFSIAQVFLQYIRQNVSLKRSIHNQWNTRLVRSRFFHMSSLPEKLQYGGFLKWCTPKSFILVGFSLINHPSQIILVCTMFGMRRGRVSHMAGAKTSI